MIRTITFGISLLVAALSQAAAQDRYPSRAIKFVVPFTAGSATDTLARLADGRPPLVGLSDYVAAMAVIDQAYALAAE